MNLLPWFFLEKKCQVRQQITEHVWKCTSTLKIFLFLQISPKISGTPMYGSIQILNNWSVLFSKKPSKKSENYFDSHCTVFMANKKTWRGLVTASFSIHHNSIDYVVFKYTYIDTYILVSLRCHSWVSYIEGLPFVSNGWQVRQLSDLNKKCTERKLWRRFNRSHTVNEHKMISE